MAHKDKNVSTNGPNLSPRGSKLFLARGLSCMDHLSSEHGDTCRQRMVYMYMEINLGISPILLKKNVSTC